MPVRRFDAVQLAGKMERTEEGYLKGDAVVTRTGVFPYRGPDGGVVMELRHPDDVFASASLETMKNCPVTLLHPVTDENPTGMVNAENVKEFGVGNVGETVQPDGRNIRATVVIRDKKAVDEIDAGAARENSMGYLSDLVDESGVYNGVPYDRRQTNIRYNHLAIVPRARVGAEARLNLDAADAEQVEGEHHSREGSMALKKVRLDNGMEYDAADEVALELESYRKRATAAEGKLDALETVKLDDTNSGKAEPAVVKHVQATQAKLDAKVEELKKLQEAGPTATAAAVKERVRLLGYAQSVLDAKDIEKLDEMPDVDIQKAVILAVTPEARRADTQTLLDAKEKEGDAGAVYIRARFDTVAEGINLRDKGAIIAQRNTVNGSVMPVKNLDGKDEPDSEASRKRMISRLDGQKTEEGK